MRFPALTTEFWRHVFFIFDFGCYIQKFTYLKFEKNNGLTCITCIIPFISKPSDTVLFCYFTLNALFFVGFFGEIRFISVKMIIFNGFM